MCSVESACHLVFFEMVRDDSIVQRRDLGASRSQPSGERPVWNIINLKNPGTSEDDFCFSWRLLSNSLPRMLNKRRHRVEQVGRCPRCGMNGRDSFHAMIVCSVLMHYQCYDGSLGEAS